MYICVLEMTAEVEQQNILLLFKALSGPRLPGCHFPDVNTEMFQCLQQEHKALLRGQSEHTKILARPVKYWRVFSK